jgi:NADPH:quinone reductase-like Zn-dependent oxidoreductase
MADAMKAVRIHAHGGLEQLRYEDAPIPTPQANEILIRVRAAALNHLDLWTTGGVPGLKLEFPHVLGNDMAGVVERTGKLVEHVQPGDDVVVAPGRGCGHCAECAAGDDNQCRRYVVYGHQIDGGFAQFAVVRQDHVRLKPAQIDWPEAAAASLVFLTAWHMLVRRAGLKPGETCLVMAAGSGVGIAAIQIARLLGARAIAAAGSDAKLERAKELGADSVVNYHDRQWAAQVRQLTGRRGVDVVADHTGEEFFEDAVSTLAAQGRLVTCGATSGPRASFDIRRLFARGLSLLGSYMASTAEWHEVWKFIAAGRLKPIVDRAYPMAEAHAAFERMVKRNQFGKLVLIPE